MESGPQLLYQRLYAYFGPQHWWPADSPFEVIVGAMLTQNTSWANVEKAIGNLKRRKLLNARKLYGLSAKKLALLIRPSGYYNIKANRLRNFLKFFIAKFHGNLRTMSKLDIPQLRRSLLSVNGIGPETADSILLYALNKPVFVIDAYTKRVLLRHGLAEEDAPYPRMQDLFMRNLKPDARLFNEYHALLVRLGKEFCLKTKPRCAICPIKKISWPQA